MALSITDGTPIPNSAGLPSLASKSLLVAQSTTAEHAIMYVEQERDQWCWAACFQMVAAYLGIDAPGQLQMAKRVFGEAACADPAGSSCNRGAFPDDVAHLFGISCSVRERALSPQELATELRYGPVEVGFEANTMTGTVSHVGLVSGVRPNGTVSFLDPWPDFGPSSPTIEQLRSHYHWGSWVRTYVQFASA